MFNLNMVEQCNSADTGEILSLYKQASELQKQKGTVVWPVFPTTLVETDIKEGRLWKLVYDNTIVCVWSLTFNDWQIWGEKDQDNAVYIHRIATRAEFRGNNFVKLIVEWTKQYAATLGKKYVRLDTLGDNQKLIQVYTSAGFKFLGAKHLNDVDGLTENYYNNRHCLLFELLVN